MNWINSTASTLLNKSLDGVWERQKAISDNIANYETPGYKRKFVNFEDELQRVLAQDKGNKALKRSELVSDINSVTVATGVAEDEISRADDNAINVDYENVELARAQIQYQALTQQMSAHFARLRSAIRGTSQ